MNQRDDMKLRQHDDMKLRTGFCGACSVTNKRAFLPQRRHPPTCGKFAKRNPATVDKSNTVHRVHIRSFWLLECRVTFHTLISIFWCQPADHLPLAAFACACSSSRCAVHIRSFWLSECRQPADHLPLAASACARSSSRCAARSERRSSKDLECAAGDALVLGGAEADGTLHHARCAQ